MDQSRKELVESLITTNRCLRWLGLSYGTPEPSKLVRLYRHVVFMMTVISISYHMFSEVMYTVLQFMNNPRLIDVVPYFHYLGYGILSFIKITEVYSKRNVCRSLIEELARDQMQAIKDKKLTTLRLAHKYYYYLNVTGVWFYILTPVVVYYYNKWFTEEDVRFGFIWMSWYPVDKYQPKAHAIIYLFEIFVGQSCVWSVIGTDMLFSVIASHISLMLRVLQTRLEAIGNTDCTEEECYQEILTNIKLHQRLIRYCNDLEEIFSVSNLGNVVVSCANICVVLFVITIIDPLYNITTKMFLFSASIQIGMLCWYGDDIMRANRQNFFIGKDKIFKPVTFVQRLKSSRIGSMLLSALKANVINNGDVAESAYKSGWYKTSSRCRRTLLFLLVRSQKPIAFTAMKFTNMTLVTFSKILMKSYSIFALLSTMYRRETNK